MLRLPLALGLVAAGLLTACAQPSDSTSPAPPSLAGTSWVLTDARTGEVLTAAVDDTGSLTFAADGTLAGSTGCNRFTGRWTAEGGALALQTGPMTMMACPGPLAAQESAVMAALGATATYDVVGTTLTLLDEDRVPLARFRAAATTLAETAWRATGVNNGAGGVVTTAQTRELTLRFAADGSVRGFGGCGDFSGSYTTDGPALSLRLAPADECATATQQQYLAALQRATTWRVDGNRLELRDGTGALQAGFAAADARR